MQNIIRYYEQYDEDSRLMRDNSHKMEFFTTVHYLDQLLQSHSRILDVGAGTGRYSFYFAEKGHHVTAVEFVQSNLEIIKDKLANNPNINFAALQGDARDLSQFANKSFDLVMCFGPLYHLTEEDDKRLTIAECLRVLKEGGILALTYINKYPVYLFEVKNVPEMLTTSNLYQTIIEQDREEENIFYFSSPEKIEHMMEEFNIEKITNVATDGISYFMRDFVDSLNEEQYQAWLKYHLSTCETPSLLGYSMHGLYLCRKGKL